LVTASGVYILYVNRLVKISRSNAIIHKERLTLKLFIALLAGCFIANGCATSSAQNAPLSGSAVSGNALVSGHYIYTSTGVLDPTKSQQVLWDGGTMEADGEGHISQCGGASWGVTTSPMNCVTHWTVYMGQSDDGQVVDGRFGWGKSDQGDIATLACTETGKICVMTSHNVQWSWTARLEKE
jgi:hypothetical protein